MQNIIISTLYQGFNLNRNNLPKLYIPIRIKFLSDVSLSSTNPYGRELNLFICRIRYYNGQLTSVFLDTLCVHFCRPILDWMPKVINWFKDSHHSIHNLIEWCKNILYRINKTKIDEFYYYGSILSLDSVFKLFIGFYSLSVK